jgi:hypothetical protein
MKPMPAAIQRIRQAAHLIDVVAQSGSKVLRLSVPIISVMACAQPIESIGRSSGMSYESFRKKFRAVIGDSPGR